MWMRYSNSSDYQPPAFNGSYPPPGEEIPTDYTSFFNFGDTPPPSPSKVKNFFGSLRNRARSNPDNDGEFKMRQRSRTNPFEDKNKLKVIVDSWGASSQSKAIDDSLITKDIPPVPKLPEVLKPSRTRLRPLAPVDIEGRHTIRGVELGIAENNVLQV
ncbi:hypothetical protein FRC04_004410 [Tulasnella sp. 424]|nr:hypothetical protein FRC04_004410 [Tulasnella sp. 424]KAG8979520.1 hypothetical protein FRC05_008509 [Tulasnella sp. 425]